MNDEPGEPDLTPKGWQQRYDNEQTGWDRGQPSPALMRWLEVDELKPGRILIPGCGRGHEAIELAKRGFEVTAIDFAESAIQALSERLIDQGLTANIVRENVVSFTAEPPFDVIYEQTCLCAIHPQDWLAYERVLHNSLKKGGKLFALFMQTDRSSGPPFHCDLEEMKTLFSGERWSWSGEGFTVDHPAGMKEIATVLTRKGG